MYQKWIKRILDFSGAFLLLPIVIIIVIPLGCLVWLTDRGPIFYNSIRAGKGYKPFRMYKLRSMYVNSPDLRNKDGSTYNSDSDPRVIPVGKFLRKTSLDEIPQFLNVLKGDMSFVGPRPKLYHEGRLEESDVTDDMKKSFMVKPGVTGYAQAYYRNSITQNEKFKWDAYYVDHVSFWVDVKIIWKTIISVLAHKNINTEQSYKG